MRLELEALTKFINNLDSQSAKQELLREIEPLYKETIFTRGKRTSRTKLRVSFLRFIEKARGTPVLTFLVMNPNILWPIERELGLRNLESEKSHSPLRAETGGSASLGNFFSECADRLCKMSSFMTHLYFSFRALQAQAYEPSYRRDKALIFTSWIEVKKLTKGSDFFKRHKPEHVLREELKRFIEK